MMRALHSSGLSPVAPLLAILFLAGALLGDAPPARAADPAAPARADIVDPAMLRLAWPTAMPNVSEASGGLSGAQFTGEIPSMGMANTMPANARLVIRRVDDTGQVVTAPVGFRVLAGTGRRGLVVRTSPETLPATQDTPAGDLPSGGDADRPTIGGGALIVDGSLGGGAAASIGVGLGPDLAATTLAVVVQYN